MLSFLFHYLLRDPRATAAIRKEVDTVCGSEPVKFEHLQKLKYIDAALKETLRLKSTAPAFTLAPIEKDEIIGGKYVVPKDTAINVILDALHRDPAVWGDDAEEFRLVLIPINEPAGLMTSCRPERMLDGKFEALPPNAWKPFGNGMRGCIGRPFAWQESLLVVATVS
jgi:cytochrome P450/NADPH-cytochrome P450 reductase